MKPESYPALDGVVLARLLVRPKSFSVPRLTLDIASLLAIAGPGAREAVDAALLRLKERGLIQARAKIVLNDAGKAAALTELGYSGLPSRQSPNWRWAKTALLQSRTAGAPKPPGKDAKLEHAMARIVARRHGIRLDRSPQKNGAPAAEKAATAGMVLRALTWRALLSVDDPAPAQTLAPVAAPRRPASPALPEDIAAFARKVNEIALAAREGRFLGDKVFIGQVWTDLGQEADAELSLEHFKRRLVEAQRAGLLTLGRADLPAKLPPELARRSRTADGERTFYFIETQQLG